MNNRFRWNPILKKEIMVKSRSMRMSWAIFGINLVFTGITWMVFAASENYTNVYYYQALSMIFQVLAITEVAILTMVIPIMTSGSISGERERQTLDIMLTTPMRPISIVSGKLMSALATVGLYVISSLPFLAISFILGGVKWHVLLGYIGMILFLGIYVGSIGIFASSIRKSSVAATILSLLLIGGIALVTFIIWLMSVDMYMYSGKGSGDADFLNFSAFLLSFNPFVGFAEFMMRSCSSLTMRSIMEVATSQTRLQGGLGSFYSAILPITIVVNLLVSYGFLRLAARRTVVTKNKRKRKKKKQA